MPDFIPNSWEPDPQQVGKNWRDMFRDPQRDGQQPAPSATRPMIEALPDEDGAALDLTEYKPWILQRSRMQLPMMLELRRYEPRSGQWRGWAMPYPNLYAVEYVGDRMVSLDFGTRQFVVEGHGLNELVRLIQLCKIWGVVEHNTHLWPTIPERQLVTAIRCIGID